MAKANKIEEKPAENKKRVMLAKEADAEPLHFLLLQKELCIFPVTVT